MSYDPYYNKFDTEYIVENPITKDSITLEIEANLICTGPDPETGYRGERGVEDGSLKTAVVLSNGVVIERDSDIDDAFKVLFDNGYTNDFGDWEDVFEDFSDKTMEEFIDYMNEPEEPDNDYYYCEY